jgi:hypothetical protein
MVMAGSIPAIRMLGRTALGTNLALFPGGILRARVGGRRPPDTVGMETDNSIGLRLTNMSQNAAGAALHSSTIFHRCSDMQGGMGRIACRRVGSGHEGGSAWRQ